MIADYKFECQFCKKKFKLEHNYMDHVCKQMIRDKEIRTPIGQAAWNMYQTWMRAQRKAVPKIQTFLESRYYATFVKNAKFVQKVGIPDVDVFIRYMVENKMPPALWKNDEIYASFLQHIDNRQSPEQQAKTTIEYLFKVADDIGVDVSEVFDHMTAEDIIPLLRRRQISPWILLASSKFKALVQRATDEQKMILSTMIKPDVWKRKKQENPTASEKMKVYVKELNL